MAKKGDKIIMLNSDGNAWVGRKGFKNRVSIPCGTVGVITGYTRSAVRVQFLNDSKIHTVMYGMFMKTSMWPGQLRLWWDHHNEKTVLQVINCLGWNVRNRGHGFVWVVLKDGELLHISGESIMHNSEVINDNT
jgi:hypothetical protein